MPRRTMLTPPRSRPAFPAWDAATTRRMAATMPPGNINNTISLTNVSGVISVTEPSSPQSISTFTGIVYLQSQVTSAQVLDGLSMTFLAGEKYLCPDNYESAGQRRRSGLGFGIRLRHSPIYLVSLTASSPQLPPLPDTKGAFSETLSFGSPHTAVTMMSFCDGSVRAIAMDIDPRRSDGWAIVRTSRFWTRVSFNNR